MHKIVQALVFLPTAYRFGIPFRFIFRTILRGRDSSHSRLFGKKFCINSAFWFLHGIVELFQEECYLFHAASDEPRIIDCGANTGLSVLYFKQRYPRARITAFEPDPDICGMLLANLKSFGHTDVEVRRQAVWTHNGDISFIASGGVGGRIGEDGSKRTATLPAARLRDLLDEPVDFLKIDIEGAEGAVIKDCADALGKVQHIFIEYHSSEKLEQELDDILRILREAGFRYYLKEAWVNQPRPYTNKRENLFDLQLNIFGYRPEST